MFSKKTNTLILIHIQPFSKGGRTVKNCNAGYCHTPMIDYNVLARTSRRTHRLIIFSEELIYLHWLANSIVVALFVFLFAAFFYNKLLSGGGSATAT